MFVRRSPFVVAAALTLALACENKDASAPASEPSAAPTSTLAAASAVASAPPAPRPSASAPAAPSASVADRPSKTVAGASTTVKLLAPGAEPRRELRYHYQKGQSEHARLVSGTGLTMEVSGRKVELPAMPDLEMNALIRVVDLLPSGSARRQLAIDKVELRKGGIDQSLRDDVEKALSTLEGLKGRDLIDTRGFIHELKLEKVQAQPELRQFLESLQQALGQMGAPFPDEAVGKGARWRIETKVMQQGIDLRQTAIYELVDLQGDKGRAKIELKQSSPAGNVNPPGLPAGVKAELLSLDSRGDGELRFDLAHMVPDGRVTTKSRIRVRTQLPTGGSQEATMNVTARATFMPTK